MAIKFTLNGADKAKITLKTTQSNQQRALQHSYRSIHF